MTKLQKQAVQYCNDVISGREITTDEVKIQCQMTLDELALQENEDYPYFIDTDFLDVIEGILSLLNYATGIGGIVGQPIINHLHNFQCYFLFNVFGWKYKNNPQKYRFNYITLFIVRKTAKSFIAAVCMIIYLLTEPKYSEFYSICINRELASKIKEAITQILNVSPAISKHFKKIPTQLTGKVTCLLTNSFYQARVSEANSNNSIRPSAFIADEVGAFKTKDNILAMRSGQKSVLNAIQINLTSAYAIDHSIMFEELDYIKGVYHKTKEPNDRMFALLYYAQKEYLWNDVGLQMANPLRIEDNYNAVREERKMALEKPLERSEYLAKDMNYFVPANAGETFINIEDFRKCKAKVPIVWEGRTVYIGWDFSLSNDNTSITMVAYDNENDLILAKSWAFIPSDSIDEKSKLEKIDYNSFVDQKYCFACGDRTIDYKFLEDFTLQIENNYGVVINSIGYDRYNAISSAKKMEAEGLVTVEIRQHSDTLHAPTKLLKEYILNQKFCYDENELYEINFENAKETKDTNLNIYLNKKKSGKIDMCASTIDGIYLLQQTEILCDDAPAIMVV